MTATENNGDEVEQEQTERKKVDVPTIDDIELKEVPVYIICPKCGEKGITITETKRSKEAVLISLCLCLLQYVSIVLFLTIIIFHYSMKSSAAKLAQNLMSRNNYGAVENALFAQCNQ